MLAVLAALLGALALLCGSAAGAQACPNEQLRAEQPYGPTLADCRAYELVSPLNDYGIISIDSRASVSDESPAIAYLSEGSFSEPKSALITSRYIARRGPHGWATQNLSPPYTSIGGNSNPLFQELLFTPELSKGLEESIGTPLLGEEVEPAGYDNLYVADTSSNAYQVVTTVHPREVEPYSELVYSPANGPHPAGVSTDLSHVVFQQSGELVGVVSAGEPETDHVYEWADGVLRLVDVPPEGGQPFEARDGAGASGSFWIDDNSDEWHAVSADGSRVFFTAGEGKGGREREGQVYVREEPMSPVEDCSVSGDACTVEASASQRTNARGEPEPDPNDHTTTENSGEDKLRPARYWGATADGAMVFFTSRAELTNNADTGPADNAENLYEYDVEDGDLTDITPENAEGAGVLGLLTSSEDGSYVYFAADGKLTTRANSKAEEPESGKPNLYLYHGVEVMFIATLAPATGMYAGVYEEGGDASDWAGAQPERASVVEDNWGPEQHTVRVASDGTLAFESERRLTGFDNEQAQKGDCEERILATSSATETGECHEVYLFNPEGNGGAGTLICASCDRGARPAGPSRLDAKVAASVAGGETLFDLENTTLYVPRNLSENGSRLFFESLDALVPQDSNGFEDVYEWEAQGEGSCGQLGGCVYPISDVAGGYESHFMDASSSGDNVFIATKDQLVTAAEGNSRVNLYDVRVDGGLPEPARPSACTNADSCRPPVSPQPAIFAAPASATFSGAGNPAPPPPPAALIKAVKKTVKCANGRVRNKRGKCVRKRSARKAKRARSASNDGRAKP
jgi:hypothetical protein